MTTIRGKRHSPEQIVRKLRDADAMLNAGKDFAAVLQSLEVSAATLHRWRAQYWTETERIDAFKKLGGGGRSTYFSHAKKLVGKKRIDG